MQKNLVWLAVSCTLCGSAHAQSAVTVYGSFDGGVRHLTNVDAAGNSRTSIGSNGLFNPNRLGFKGVEDLGDGMNAHFTLESGFNSGTGALDNAGNVLFNRTAAVGIGGKWGSLDVGRQYTVAFKTMLGYETFRYQYPSVTQSVFMTAGFRNNNDIQYIVNLGGLTVRTEYAAGEQAGSSGNGATEALGVTYADGPVNAGAAYTRKKNLVGAVYRDYTHYTAGGAYTAGPWRANLGYIEEIQETAAFDTRNRYVLAGLSYRFEPTFAVTGGYYATRNKTAGLDGKRRLYLISAVYSLSKRTDLYLENDRATFSGTLLPATARTGQTGISTGINHFF